MRAGLLLQIDPARAKFKFVMNFDSGNQVFFQPQSDGNQNLEAYFFFCKDPAEEAIERDMLAFNAFASGEERERKMIESMEGCRVSWSAGMT